MRNAEYGNLYGHTVFKATDSGMVGSDFLVNSLGENLSPKYLPDKGPAGVFLPVKLAIGLEKEVAEASSGEIDAGEAKMIKDIIFEPMQDGNTYSPVDAISVLGDITAPMKFSTLPIPIDRYKIKPNAVK